jgi:tellurite resistance protein
MVSTSKPFYSDQQISAWLRGLFTIAWADGHFDPEEKELITQLTQEQLTPATKLGDLEIIAPQELAEVLGDDPNTKENFLRTAVMMAIANGVYSEAEAKIVHEFQEALGLNLEALKSLEATLCYSCPPQIEGENILSTGLKPHDEIHHDVLNPVRKWLDGIDIHDPRLARFLCKMIPSQCPFERDIKLFGKKIVHIPPMCKVNPLYEQMVGLRFRSLSYLADECKEDVTPYL